MSKQIRILNNDGESFTFTYFFDIVCRGTKKERKEENEPRYWVRGPLTSQ